MGPLESYPREVRVFLLASLINATGSALMWPLVSMFVFDELGRSMSDAGLVILVQSMGGIAGQLLGGSLYHRVGVQRLIVGSLAMNALALFTLPVTSHSWYPFMVAMGFVGLFNALSMPAIQAFVGFRFTERRAELFNIIYVANNIGVALGTAMSGFLADISYSLSFVLNGVSSAVFAIFFLFYLRRVNETYEGDRQTKSKSGENEGNSVWPLLLNIRLYLFMALGALLLQVGNSIWNTGVSPFIVAEGLPKKAYGFLWTLNGVLIFAGQPIIYLVKRFAARTVLSQMTASSLFYSAGYAVILVAHSYPGMLLGMTLATFGEMLISPAMPAFISEHGGKHAPFYIGLTGGIGSAGRVLGPFIMGTLYDEGGLNPVAWLAAGTGILSILFYLVHASVNRFGAHSKGVL